MRSIWSIAWLTFREGVRMRVVLVFLGVLALLVVTMPFTLRGDETVAGRLQNFLAYSLGAVSVLLSLTTIFFSCSTLSNEFKDRTLHLLVTKPVARLQILAGKWLGVNLLNALILVLSAAAIYGLACFLRTLPEQFARDRYKVRDVVWTARVAANPTVPWTEIREAARQDVMERIQTGAIDRTRERQALAERMDERYKRWRVVPAGAVQVYRFENLAPPEREDTIFQVRYKIIAQPLPMDEMIVVGFAFCDPDTGAPLEQPVFKQERSTMVHQFLASARPMVRNGKAALAVINPYGPERPTGLILDGDNSLQILYQAGGFEMNFVRTVAVILLRLSFLSAVGVFFSVFVSFPVACLCAGTFFLVCLGMPFWLESIGAEVEGYASGYDPFGKWGGVLRRFFVPFLTFTFPNFAHYDGTRHLVEGEFVSYDLLGRCLLHTLVYGGLLLLVPGWLIFREREVAEVQV